MTFLPDFYLHDRPRSRSHTPAFIRFQLQSDVLNIISLIVHFRLYFDILLFFSISSSIFVLFSSYFIVDFVHCNSLWYAYMNCELRTLRKTIKCMFCLLIMVVKSISFIFSPSIGMNENDEQCARISCKLFISYVFRLFIFAHDYLYVLQATLRVMMKLFLLLNFELNKIKQH